MEETRRIAGLIRDWLARERISRDEFAHRTRLGRSTVDKLLVGQFSARTLAVVEAETGLALRGAPAVVAPEPVMPAMPDGPSIAVLPFVNLAGGPDGEVLADGFAEDITTALSRLRWLFVIARQSAFAWRGRAVDIRQVARELGVRYVLEGSVRTAAGRIRVTAQIADAETGQHVWAERYDRALDDVFAVQDEITASVVAAIEPQLYAREGLRAAARPPERLDAWGLVVRAMGLIHRAGRERSEEARALLARAIALAPGYARAHAVLAWTTWWAARCYYLEDLEEGYRTATRHAEDAAARDPAEPWARLVLGMGHSEARRQERALAELRAALDLNPSFALGHTMLGWVLTRIGRFEEGVAETGLALRMSPLDSFAGLTTSFHGLGLIALRRFEEALPHLRASVAALSDYSGHHHSLICCCGHLGLIEEARQVLAARNRISPPMRRAVIRARLEGFAYRDVFMEGLERAGVPE
ncbi:MAG TPA: hypothetical protein VD970_17415 [Acetobacteraceae bacterium]|nr:hypothetical protein [Acetobacteraceae bacterium]